MDAEEQKVSFLIFSSIWENLNSYSMSPNKYKLIIQPLKRNELSSHENTWNDC